MSSYVGFKDFMCSPGRMRMLFFCLNFLKIMYHCSLPQIFLQSNPVARWHIGQGSVNCIAFSNDGAYLATVGRDGMMFFFVSSVALILSLNVSFCLSIRFLV